MLIKQLDNNFKNKFFNMVKETEKSLENPLWFLPLTKEELKMFNGKNFILFGAFSDNNDLMAISGLFHNKHQFADITNFLNIKNKTTELGRCMVLPKYRGKNLMLKLNIELLKKAKELGFKTVIATAHPDNEASNKSLVALGMKNQNTILRNNKYLRNVYKLDIS